LKKWPTNTLATETQLASARHPLTASQQEWWQSGRYALDGCVGRLIGGPVAQPQVMGRWRLTSPTSAAHRRRSVERREIARPHLDSASWQVVMPPMTPRLKPSRLVASDANGARKFFAIVRWNC